MCMFGITKKPIKYFMWGKDVNTDIVQERETTKN